MLPKKISVLTKVLRHVMYVAAIVMAFFVSVIHTRTRDYSSQLFDHNLTLGTDAHADAVSVGDCAAGDCASSGGGCSSDDCGCSSGGAGGGSGCGCDSGCSGGSDGGGGSGGGG